MQLSSAAGSALGSQRKRAGTADIKGGGDSALCGFFFVSVLIL